MIPLLEKSVIGPECFTFPFDVGLSTQRQVVFQKDAIEGIMGMFHHYCSLSDITRISIFAESFYRIKVGSLVIATNAYRGSSPYSYVIGRYNCNGDFEYRPAIISALYCIKAFRENNAEPSSCTKRFLWSKCKNKS